MARMKDRGDKRKARKTLFIPDLSKVEGKRPLAPEGEYLIRVVEVTTEEGDSGDYYKWVFEKADGKNKGARVYHNTSLAPQALWNLRGILESLGVEIEDGDMELDLSDLVGMTMMAEIGHEQNDGYRKQARILDHSPADGGDEEEEEVGDDDGEPEDDPKARRRERAAARRAKRNGKHDDDNDEEAEEKSGKGKKSDKKSGKSKKPSLTVDAIKDMDEDELSEVIEEHELEVDLDEHPTLKKKKAAVIDAAEDAGILDE